METAKDKTTAEMYEEDVDSIYTLPPADKEEEEKKPEPEKQNEPPTKD